MRENSVQKMESKIADDAPCHAAPVSSAHQPAESEAHIETRSVSEAKHCDPSPSVASGYDEPRPAAIGNELAVQDTATHFQPGLPDSQQEGAGKLRTPPQLLDG